MADGTTSYKKFLDRMTRAWIRVEKAFSALTEDKHNPWYYHGAIPVMFFITLIISGILIWLYYVPTLRGAYLSVEYFSNPERHPFGFFIRGLHRYTADAMIVASLLHMFKVYVTDRHRGYRHIVWLSGIFMLAFVLIIGISGYLLIWDGRALRITELTVGLLQWLDHLPLIGMLGWGNGLAHFFIGGPGVTDFTIARFFFLHIGLSVAIFFVLWIHFLRIKNPVVYTSFFQTLFFLGIVVMFAGLIPIKDMGAAVVGQSPQTIPIDWFYHLGFYFMNFMSPGAMWLLIAATLAILFLAPYVPMFNRRGAVEVIEANCTGCRLCSIDCPYNAIEMIETPQRKRKLLAVINAARCAQCGICVGACPFEAIELPALHTRLIENQIDALLAEPTGAETAPAA